MENHNSAVINNPKLGRYEHAVEGHIAAAYYHRSKDVVTFDKTEVPPELRGRHFGGQLVEASGQQTLGEIKRRGKRNAGGRIDAA